MTYFGLYYNKTLENVMYIELINHNDHVETLKSHDQSA